jgi:threonine aldolase
LAEGLNQINDVTIDLKNVQTNIVHFDVSELLATSDQFVSKLRENGVLALPRDKKSLRMVTHRGIKKEDIDKTLNIIESIVKELHG